MSSVAWVVVLPVKPTFVAKTRLTGSDDRLRQRLALAFATDTVTSVVACGTVSSVVVVTDDAAAASMARSKGAVVLADAPRSGLNAALVHGSREVRLRDPQAAVALLSADLPALRPGELEAALHRCGQYSRAFVCDAVGTGTTLLTAMAPDDPSPRFGARSRARHRYDGCVEISDAGLASLRRDVDTWADLADAQRLGVGPATSSILAEG